MNRTNRRRVNLLANAIEDFAEGIVGWLRAKAERKYRQRPLVFPSRLTLQMEGVFAKMVQAHAKKFVDDLRYYDRLNWPEGLMYRADQGRESINRIRKPDADA